MVGSPGRLSLRKFDSRSSNRWPRMGASLARYVTVCREWQGILELKTFGRLKLILARLVSFGDMIQGREELVKHIWLCIELQEYDCSRCEGRESDSWHERNTEIIKASLRELFLVLSAWGASESLVLDISAHSASDSRHRFKLLHHGSDALSESCNSTETSDIHDYLHGWINGRIMSTAPGKSIDRLYEDIEMALDYWRALPEVPAVTGLLVRRQNRRRWTPGTLKNLLKLLPRLQELCYEPWREWDSLGQRRTDESKFPSDLRMNSACTDLFTVVGSQVLFESLVPNRLRRMVLIRQVPGKVCRTPTTLYNHIPCKPASRI